MSLQIWLPLIKDANNQGLSQITTITSGNNINYTTNGKLGKCVSASANSNNTIVITIPGLANMLANGKQYSVACWVKMTENATANSWVIKLGSNTCGLWWGVSEARWVWNENDNGKRCANPTISADATNWHHLITTVDKSVTGSITAKHYVDGLPAASYETQTWDNSSHSQPAGDTITLTPYVSLLNDVRIYDHVLSEKEIKELSKGLVLHYKLSGTGLGQNNIFLNSHFDTRYSQTSGWDTSKNGTLLASNWGGYNSGVTNASTVYHAHLKQMDSIYVYEYIRTANETWLGISQGGLQSKLTAGTTYTFSWDQYCVEGANYVGTGLYYYKTGATSAAFHLGQAYGNTNRILGQWQHFSYTFTAPSDGDYSKNMSWYIYGHYGGNGTMYMKNPKLEVGSIDTRWAPNTSDVAYTGLKLGENTIEYDVSGYGNNGTKYNISISGDTPRYGLSYLFNGSSSYIKTNDSLWRYDGATELSINFWASMDDWTAFNMRLYSCTEGGGYNVEPSGNNISFSMNAYTDAAKSAYKYINDGGYCAIAKSSLTSGWHMFTYVYTTSGTKLYVDGNLKVNNTYTSYGVHYNATAPLIIGGEATGSGATSPYFNGKMSDFKLFYTALSTDDIKELYQVSASIDNMGNLYSYEVVEQ